MMTASPMYNSMVDSDMFMMHNLDNTYVQFSTYIFMKEKFQNCNTWKDKIEKICSTVLTKLFAFSIGVVYFTI